MRDDAYIIPMNDFDITSRLRRSPDPESVDRERYMAGSLFGDVMREADGRIVSEEQIQRWAKQSILAACIFWQEWDIACLTYIPKPDEDVVGWCVGEMK